MSSYSSICVDASLVIRILTRAASPTMAERWRVWRSEGRELIAPTLLGYEVTNAMHRVRASGGADEAQVEAAMQGLSAIPIRYHAAESLHRDALILARDFHLGACHDAHYLALASREGAEFWTYDKCLHNSVRHRLTWVRLAD
ncbi:MAG: type II toxin-antitoxin system VapC family toxin [Thermomicrobiales bacterium]